MRFSEKVQRVLIHIVIGGYLVYYPQVVKVFYFEEDKRYTFCGLYLLNSIFQVVQKKEYLKKWTRARLFFCPFFHTIHSFVSFLSQFFRNSLHYLLFKSGPSCNGGIPINRGMKKYSTLK
uniref:Uncharacterized protein n=1 Tax=Moramonas marocensis TaxID=1805496 RepID=A0A140F2J1_9EUKA|nr:hypothetical protein Mmmito_0046 [Moramonas marocensis]